MNSQHAFWLISITQEEINGLAAAVVPMLIFARSNRVEEISIEFGGRKLSLRTDPSTGHVVIGVKEDA